MANRRRDKDVMKLMASKYTYELPDENKMNEIIVNFPGPEDSPYKDVSPSVLLPITALFASMIDSKSSFPCFILITSLVSLLGHLESESLATWLVSD